MQYKINWKPFFAGFSLVSGSLFAQSTMISGTITNPVEQNVLLIYYDTELRRDAVQETAYLDDAKNFNCRLDCKFPQTVELHHGKHKRRIYLEPGDKLHLTFDNDDFNNSWKISGEGAANNLFLDNLNTTYPFFSRFQFQSANADQHFHSIDSLLQEMQRYINTEKQLSNVSEPFLHELTKELLFQAIINKIAYLQKNYAATDVEKEHTEKLRQFIETIDLNAAENLHLESFTKFIFMYHTWIYQLDNPELLLRIRTLNIPQLPEKARQNVFAEIAQVREGIARRLFQNRTLDFFLSNELIGLFEDGWISPFDSLYTVYKTEGLVVEFVSLIDKALNESSRLQPGKPAPDFTLPEEENEPTSIADLRGKVLLINFWTTWCKPCKISAPKLNRMSKHFKNKAFLLVNINLDDDSEAAKKAIREEQLAGLHLFANGFHSKIAKDYHIEGVPRYYLLDKDGKIVERMTGFFMEKALVKKIEELL